MKKQNRILVGAVERTNRLVMNKVHLQIGQIFQAVQNVCVGAVTIIDNQLQVFQMRQIRQQTQFLTPKIGASRDA